MNTKTGEMKFDSELTPEEQASKDWVRLELTPEQVERLNKMTPAERIVFVRQEQVRQAREKISQNSGDAPAHPWTPRFARPRELKRRAWEERVAEKRRAALKEQG